MRELALHLVDDILENLLLSPIEKAKQPDEIRLEVDLAKVIKQAWDEQVVAALDQAIRLLRAGKGSLTPDDVNAVLIVLETMLGPGLAALTQEDLLRFVTSAYLLGRRKTIKTLGVVPNWAQIDDWSISVSQRHGVYWVQTYYTRELGQQVASTTENLVFQQGLGRMDLARELQARLGNEWWAQGYQYWDVLASAVIQRTRNLANVNTLEAAGATTYEILAMMDERTCPICSRLDGKRFEVSQAVQLRDRILAAQSPEDVKSIAPWIAASKENLAILDRGDPKDITSRGWHLPPFHGRCRCTVVVSGFRQEMPYVRARYNKLEDSRVLQAFVTGQATATELAGGRSEDEIGDQLLWAILHEQGFDKLPDVVTEEQLNAFIGQGERELFRGISGNLAPKYTEQFRSGTLFAGYGIYGNGTYAAYGQGGFATANIYARMGGTGRILRMSLRPEARVIDYEELERKLGALHTEVEQRLHKLLDQLQQGKNRADLEEEIARLKRLIKALGDKGVYAAALGYDAIDVRTEEYMVILNRTAVRVQREDLMPRARS